MAAHKGSHLVGELAFLGSESEVHAPLPGRVLIAPEFSGEAVPDKPR
jgi:hypothetical protein